MLCPTLGATVTPRCGIFQERSTAPSRVMPVAVAMRCAPGRALPPRQQVSANGGGSRGRPPAIFLRVGLPPAWPNRCSRPVRLGLL